MDPATEIARLLDRQDRVIARRQVIAAGADPALIARRLRRREWTVIHPGVYVAHTGEPTWQQRAWAGVGGRAGLLARRSGRRLGAARLRGPRAARIRGR